MKTAERRQVVAELARKGLNQTEIVREVTARGIVNPKTGKPLSRTAIINDLNTLGRGGKIAKEIIGRYTYVKPIWGARVLLNVDKIQTDYIFWSALRRGKARGYELGSLFCSPIIQILTSYVFSTGLSASLAVQNYQLKEAQTGRVIAEENKKPTTVLPNVTTNAPTAGNAKAAGSGRLPSTAGQPQANPKADQGQPQPGQEEMAPPPPPPDVKEDPEVTYTNKVLSDMVRRNQSFFTQMVTDLYALGDQYVVLNPDCSFSLASPETVTVEYSPVDYRTPLRYIIRTKMERAVVTDVYTAETRSLLIHYFDGRPDVIQTYENLLGRIPIVHFACDRETNEIYGRPIYEALLPLMSRYDDLLQKTLQGVELVANPIPTFTKLSDIQETINANLSLDDESYTDVAGKTTSREVLRFDRMPAIFVGKDGDFKFSSPGSGFTTDIMASLNHLFVLMLQHCRIPRFIWGDSIQGSRASTDSQLPPFVEAINYRRLQLTGQGPDEELGLPSRGGFAELFDLWLRQRHLINPSIVVGPVSVDWPRISTVSDMVQLQWTMALLQAGALTQKTALEIANLVPDADVEIAKAHHELPPQFDEFEARLDQDLLDQIKKEAQSDDLTGGGYDSLLTGTHDPNIVLSGLNRAKLNMTGEDLTKMNLDNELQLAAPALWVGIGN